MAMSFQTSITIFHIQFTAVGDITAENLTIAFPHGISEVCLQLLAVDDEIVEDDEVFVITFKTNNVNDVVMGTVSVEIVDNDGAY